MTEQRFGPYDGLIDLLVEVMLRSANVEGPVPDDTAGDRRAAEAAARIQADGA